MAKVYRYPTQKSVIDHLRVYSADGFKNTTDIQLIRDTEKECFLAFKNGVVKITKEDIEFKKYSSVAGSIFERSIIQRNFQGASRINNMDINKERHLFREFVEKAFFTKIITLLLIVGGQNIFLMTLLRKP